MILKIKNNICVLEADGSFQERSFLLNYCTAYEKIRTRVIGRYGIQSTYVNEPRPLYKTIKKGKVITHYVFPRGLYNLIDDSVKECLRVEDKSYATINFPKDEVTTDFIRSSLQPNSGFDLRSDQVSSVYKALCLKRGVIQLPTGGGKTEVMSSIIRILKKYNPDIKVLVIEPTDVLTIKTAERFNRYDLNATTYKDSRNDFSHTVTVAHTVSILNDLESNPKLLNGINAVFWDECHHLVADTWLKLNSALMNVEYAIGMSALAVDEKNLYETNLRNLSYDESLIVGATGPVLMYVPPRYYIEQGILATPVVMQVKHTIKDLNKEDNWHKLRVKGICSDERSKLTSDVTYSFFENNRRVLILVGTKDQAFDIATKLMDYELVKDKVGISFGNRKSYLVKKDGINVTFETYKDDIINKFDSGDLSILLSTSHLDEGVDLSNLDVCILASGGKKDRRIVQRIGRALRLTKTGKYAYIIDFTDDGNGVLNYHSVLRMKLYEELIEVPKDLVFKNISLEDMTKRFKILENIE